MFNSMLLGYNREDPIKHKPFFMPNKIVDKSLQNSK